MDCKKLLLVIACGAAFVLFGASCGGNSWSVMKADSEKGGSIGLWKYCVGDDSCGDIPDGLVNDKRKVMRAFSLLAVLASIVAVAMAIVGLCSDKVKGFLASIFLVVALVCMAVALGIYIQKTEDSNFEIEVIGISFKMTYGWSFYLGWAGCVFAIVGSILGCLAK